jgi:hypothetical protein
MINTNWMRPWTELVDQSMRLSLAAPQVVAYRVARMMMAGASPSASDQREFARMGPEKVTAFTQAGTAMVTRNLALQQQAMQNAMSLWLRYLLGGWLHPAAWQRLWYANLTRGANTMPNVASCGMRPITLRAESNVRRLARTAYSHHR